MFGYKNQDEEENPEELFDHAQSLLSSGLSGGLYRLFAGKNKANDLNTRMKRTGEVFRFAHEEQNILATGIDGTAEILSMKDTGTTINLNPVIEFELKIHDPSGRPCILTAKSTISRINIPKVGDTVKIKSSPQNPMEVFIV